MIAHETKVVRGYLWKVNANEFQYDLPDQAIAKHPVEPRRAARMLVRHVDGRLEHATFESFVPQLEQAGADGVWANDTKVLHARILATKTTGGQLEVFLLAPMEGPMERVLSSRQPVRWKAMVRNAKKWSDGQASAEGTRCAMAISLEDVADDGTRIVKLAWSSLEGPEDVPAPGTFAEALDDLGKTPLPPYMRRAAVEADKEDYQTVFAMSPGSVAAPTAGLHYDDLLLKEMEGAGLGLQRLTLHVGAGTFKPLGEGDIMAHDMHAERCIVTREALTMMRDQHKRVATGTTSLRTLESLFWLAAGHKLNGHWWSSLPQRSPYGELKEAVTKWGWTDQEALDHLLANAPWDQDGRWSFETQLMVVPGYTIRMAQGLVTNFHQPGSTLLCLVAAFIGEDAWKAMYEEALGQGYRFLSYGDGSLLWLS